MSRSLACFLFVCLLFLSWISPVYRSEYHPNFKVVQMSRSILAHLSFNFYRYCQADYGHAQFRSSARLYMARISPDHRSEFRPKIRAKEMSRSFFAHLSFNFCRSCQADNRHAQYRSSARLFMARISPASRPEFSYGDLCQALFNLVQLGSDSVVCVM